MLNQYLHRLLSGVRQARETTHNIIILYTYSHANSPTPLALYIGVRVADPHLGFGAWRRHRVGVWPCAAPYSIYPRVH